MEIKKLPRIAPSETVVWLDFEGVLVKDNILPYLFSYRPFLALTSLFKGLVEALSLKIQNYKTNFREELIEKCKKCYEEGMSSSELSRLGSFIFQDQPQNHKKSLIELLYVLKEGYHDLYVITSANKEIVRGFLDHLSHEIRPKEENIYASEKKFIGSDEKAEIVESIKKKTSKKIIGVGDSREDEKALEKSDVRCIISSLPYKLMPIKSVEYKFKNLSSVKSFLSLILLDYELHNLES